MPGGLTAGVVPCDSPGMQCPLCRARSARRQCPAQQHTICTVCCGTKRQTEIACPDSCVHLRNAHAHPPTVVRRQQELDVAVLFPGMQGLSQAQQQLFFLTLSLVVTHSGGDLALDAATDADVAEGLTALATTYETAARGVIYEQRPGSVPAQRMATEIKKVYDEIGRERPTSFAAELARVLRRLAERIDEAHRAGLDSRRGFLELAQRVAGQLARAGAESPDAPAAEVPSLLVP